MKSLLLTTSAITLSLAVAGPSHADTNPGEPHGPARNAMITALQTCGTFLKAHTSPGELEYERYAEYHEAITTAVANDPQVIQKTKNTWSATVLSAFVPKELYPKCEKYVSDFEHGVDADKQPALWGNCAGNVEKNLTRVREDIASFATDKSRSQIWATRRDLEAARYMLYLTGWTQPASQSCAPNDKFKKAFVPLATKLKATEADVVRFEASQIVRFAGIENGNHLKFVDSKTNRPVNVN